MMIEQMTQWDGAKEANKEVTTPGMNIDEEKDDMNQELDSHQARAFCSMAARCLYLSFDRPDIQFLVKEICRQMSRPTVSACRKLQRISRYVRINPRMVWNFKWQDVQTTIDIFGDSNWAACSVSRRSTSGGAVVIGTHCIRTWSRTQNLIAKSSAEAELYASVRAACEALGVQTLLKDLGQELAACVHIDTSAAKSMTEREGRAKIRHVDVNVLWIQEQEVRRQLPLCKIIGTLNLADLMTWNLARQDINKNLDMLNIMYKDGRAPELHLIRMASEVHSAALAREQKNEKKSEESGTSARQSKGVRKGQVTVAPRTCSSDAQQDEEEALHTTCRESGRQRARRRLRGTSRDHGGS